MLKEVSLTPSVRWLFANNGVSVNWSFGPPTCHQGATHGRVFGVVVFASCSLFSIIFLVANLRRFISGVSSTSFLHSLLNNVDQLSTWREKQFKSVCVNVRLCVCLCVCVSLWVLVSLCFIIFVLLHGARAVENKAVFTAYVTPKRPKSKSVTEGRTERLNDRQTNRLTDQHMVF